MKLFPFLLTILFPLFFALRNSEGLKENLSTTEFNRHKHNRRWHQYQFILQGLFALAIALTQDTWFFRGMAFAMVISWFWLVFDVAVNLFNNRPGLYLSDNGIDKILKRIGEIPTLILKVFLVIISTTWFFINPFTL